MTIDSHAHVFLRHLPMPDRRRAPSGYDASPQQYLQTLDEHGVSHGVLVQPSFLGTDNSYMLAALRAHPQRLRGIAVVAPGVAAAELDALQRAGVVGIRLNQVGAADPDFGSAAWRALLAELRQRRLLVEVHQQACGLRALLEPLLAAGLAVVVDHFGRPDPALGIDDPGFRYLLSLGASGRVWVKLSAAYRNGAAGAGERSAGAAVPLLLEHYGLGHLVWGSDWPHTLFERSGFYRMQQRLLDEWLPDEAQRRQVLHDTPAKLFSFDR